MASTAHIDTVNNWNDLLQCQYNLGTSKVSFELAPGEPTPTNFQDDNSVGALIDAPDEGAIAMSLGDGVIVAQWLGDSSTKQTTGFTDGATITVTFDSEANVTIEGGDEPLKLPNPGAGTLVVANDTSANYIQWWVGDSVGSGVASGTLGNTSSGLPNVTVSLTGSSPWQATMGPFGTGYVVFDDLSEGGRISVGIELDEPYV